MWFEPPGKISDWVEAQRYLRRSDPVLRKVIDRVGPCTLAPRRDYFVVLCKSIYSQQISVAAATKLFGRFRDHFPQRRPTPARVRQLLATQDVSVLQRCGLSRQKCAYIKDLSERFVAGEVPTRRLSRMSDEQIIDSLVRVKGIGRWTAEMFLMFVLNRPDVFPTDDLGLREGVREVYGLSERPTLAELTKIGETWRPFRTVATWYIWRRNAEPVVRRVKRPAK